MKTTDKMFNSHRKQIILCIAILLLFGGGLYSVFYWLTSPMPSPDGDVLTDKKYYIAHAAGALNGHQYLNCKEALIETVENGYKYVELDLGLTKDSVLVCLHDWNLFHKMTLQDTLNDQPITVNEFRDRRIYNQYTPLTIEDVLSIRKEHPFIIVTDKLSNVEILDKYFTQDKSSIMVEAFKDYEKLKKAGYTPMMSLCKFDYGKMVTYFIINPLIKQQKIDWICVDTTSNMKSLRLLKRLFNCKVAMYTSNSPSFFKEHLGKEVDLIYTDRTTSQERW